MCIIFIWSLNFLNVEEITGVSSRMNLSKQFPIKILLYEWFLFNFGQNKDLITTFINVLYEYVYLTALTVAL